MELELGLMEITYEGEYVEWQVRLQGKFYLVMVVIKSIVWRI